MEISEKAKIYYNVWCCAHQRRYLYRGTPREDREHATIDMCLRIAKWWSFDSEKTRYLE